MCSVNDRSLDLVQHIKKAPLSGLLICFVYQLLPFDTSYTKTHIKAFIEGRLESLEWAKLLRPMNMTLLEKLKNMIPEEKSISSI
jgi:hypothetical protein